MLELCKKAINVGLMFKYHPGVHTMEVQTKTGLYWARAWQNPDGKVCIVCDMNGEMIENCEPGVMLDIGANVGRYSIPMATKATRVWAFEPEPKNFERLVEHTTQYPNIVPVNLALSNKLGTAQMFLRDRWGEQTMVKQLVPEEDIRGTVEINTTTVDEFCKEFSITDITAIKIDVEGAEAMVLEGARKTLAKENPMIALETHMHADLRIVAEILHETGYEIMAPNGQIIQELLPDLQVICQKPK